MPFSRNFLAYSVLAAFGSLAAIPVVFASPVVPVYDNAGGIAAAPVIPARDNRDLLAPVTVNAANRDWVTHVLPTGRIVSPVGTVNGTPNLATNVIPLAKNTLAVLANGATAAQTVTLYNAHSLQPVAQVAAYKKEPEEKGEASVKDSTPIGHQSFYQGITPGPNDTFFTAGGATNDVVQFRYHDGKVEVLRRYPLAWQPFPKDQYPYYYQGEHRANEPRLFYPDAVVLGPQQRHLFVTGMLSNSIARIDLQTGKTEYLNVGPYPFALTLADGGKRLVVSLWGADAVAVLDPESFRLLGTVAVGPQTGPDHYAAGVHPTALVAAPQGPDVYVALANVDQVAEVDSRSLQLKGVLNDSPYPDAPPGSYPNALAIAQGKLFVANAGNNDVAVYDLASGKALGLIPTGWYPTGMTATQDALYVVAAKGLGTGPNVQHQWVGTMMDGLLQKIPLAELDTKLPQWTAAALHNDGFSPQQQAARQAEDAKTTAFLRKHIRYVVFILRENKTFDEDLGDYQPAGVWADPKLDLYGPKELPNLYALASRYSLFVNFMADGEVTAQGHQWTTAASDSDFVQRTWPMYYSGRGLVGNPGWTQPLIPVGEPGKPDFHPSSDDPYAIYKNLLALGKWSNPWISYPQRLFLFNDLLEHHVSFEDFGEFVSRSQAGNISPAMQKHLATDFPGWDRMLLDTQREQLAENWLKAHPGAKFPRFIYIWLPDDHTAGRTPCYYTPDYYVANNDYATAKFIHYLSTTPEWKHMVVFLTEDDAQSGADHINAHRTFALAMGPWVKRGFLETNLYSQVNILKTTEAIFGLPPMSQWDQNASVFSGIWTDHPDFAPTPQPTPIQVPLAFNPGQCTDSKLLRREAGMAGHSLSGAWFRRHQDSLGSQLPPPAKDVSYSPTTLLKVPGPEQMKQEWIASKGEKSYERVMAYLQQMAAAHHAPLAAYQAGEDE
ncbi:bifunctional YncE family protein/alkaline phosphatase family protein [Candidatus Igneacidithiobacillus taiwanensis]|uniref:bifunctional YncE family protein/alkaline phosphatase family protein n=1 Tax=Candidatus Igneacidithiobacillus taiwanensis TaxID=1945924 RepID=UPI0028995A86|nr:alkaline phosphatase family protein [Candidatus Igneacidithiobacillus taiwanensis]